MSSGGNSRRPHGSRGDSPRSSATPMGSGTSTPKETMDIYRPLANQVSKPLQPLIASSSVAFSSTLIPDLLSLSRSAYTSKVQNKALNFASSVQTNTDEAKAVKGRKRNRGDPESLEAARRSATEKEEGRRKLGIPNRAKRKRAVLDAGVQLSYERLKPLHHLHTIYLSNLLNLPPASTGSGFNLVTYGLSADMMLSKLSKADFTGASLAVSSARNPSLVGLSGLVIEETASTFRLLTSQSVIKVIPKNGTLFNLSFPATAPPPSTTGEDEDEGGSYRSTIMSIPPESMDRYIDTTPRIVVPLLGTNFGFRSGDRAGRKFRPTQGGGGGSGWGEEWVKGEWSDILELLDGGDGGDDEGGEPGTKKGAAGRDGSGRPVKRRRGKARRKDPPAYGALEIC